MMTSRQVHTEVSGQKEVEIELEGLDSKQEILYSIMIKSSVSSWKAKFFPYVGRRGEKKQVDICICFPQMCH